MDNINVYGYTRKDLQAYISEVLTNKETCNTKRIILEVTHGCTCSTNIKLLDSSNRLIKAYPNIIGCISSYTSIANDYITSTNAVLTYVITGIPHIEITDEIAGSCKFKITITSTKLNIDNLRNFFKGEGFDIYDRTQIDITITELSGAGTVVPKPVVTPATPTVTPTQAPRKAFKNIIEDAQPKIVLPTSRHDVEPNVIVSPIHSDESSKNGIRETNVEEFTKQILNTVCVTSEEEVRMAKEREKAIAEQAKQQALSDLDNQISFLKQTIEGATGNIQPTIVDTVEDTPEVIDSVKEASDIIHNNKELKNENEPVTDDKVADELEFD